MSIFGKKYPSEPWELKDIVNAGRVGAVLPEDCTNEGTLTLKSGVKIDGTQVGNVVINGSGSVLWISEKGSVRGEINAPQVYVTGSVNGSIIADLLVIEENAKVTGRIYADRIVYRNLKRASLRVEISDKRALKESDSTLPAQLVPIQLQQVA